MLGMDYTDAYYLHLNTLIYLHKNLRNVYDALLRNANRALVTTDIEFMHRLLAGMASNQAIRGWEGFNAIIGELPEFETAEEFYNTHGTLFKENKPRAWTMNDPEKDPANSPDIDKFALKLKALLTKISTSTRKATRSGEAITSPHSEFGAYPARLLGLEADWAGRR